MSPQGFNEARVVHRLNDVIFGTARPDAGHATFRRFGPNISSICLRVR